MQSCSLCGMVQDDLRILHGENKNTITVQRQPIVHGDCVLSADTAIWSGLSSGPILDN